MICIDQSTMHADHFKNVAHCYAQFRPRYPQCLFEILAREAPGLRQAWDCATGSGQAATALARIFEAVTATDASAAQLEQRETCERVTYRVAPAEASGLEPESVDLITVAQALHWFPLEAFFQECQRVLRPGGILAVWTYGLFSTNDQRINQIIQGYCDAVAPYWPPQRALVDDGYRGIQLPFVELDPAELGSIPLTIQEAWNLEQLKGYLRSWSASGYYVAAQARDPLDPLKADLDQAWGHAGEVKIISWPLTVRVARKPFS
jgi:ubiquinone/menaquinone biosynthesis C-methylase UbiE